MDGDFPMGHPVGGPSQNPLGVQAVCCFSMDLSNAACGSVVTTDIFTKLPEGRAHTPQAECSEKSRVAMHAFK